ncbi:hypothetical protein AGMMS49982_18590 [Bacteroidia bacterium]|nr:hypothetical protein AGMMS49982_18590 [Bacteroidia bacterium]
MENSLMVIAVGGGGLNVAKFISKTAKEAKRNINLFAIDTEEDDLMSSGLDNKILIQDENSTEEVEGKLNPHLGGVKIGVVISALGGRTGSTLTPQIAKLLHEHKIASLCIVTTPFALEGKDAASRALNSIVQILECHSTLVQKSNESLAKEMGTLSLVAVFQYFDAKIADLVFAINDASLQGKESLIIPILQEGKEFEGDDLKDMFTKI